MIKVTVRYNDHLVDIHFPCSENTLQSALMEIHATDDNPPELFVADHPQIDTVYLCHDSDVDGQKAAVRIANKLTEQGINTEILVPIHKDWNEDLLYPPDETEEEICIQTM